MIGVTEERQGSCPDRTVAVCRKRTDQGDGLCEEGVIGVSLEREGKVQK